MNKKTLIASTLAAALFSGVATAATIQLTGNPSTFTLDGSSMLSEPTGVMDAETVTFNRIEPAGNEEVNNIEIQVESDFTTSLTITNNSGANAIVNFTAEAIQTASSPNDSDQLSNPTESLNVSAGGLLLAGATSTFSDNTSVDLAVDLDVGDFIATGPGQTVDVVVSAVFNVVNFVAFNFAGQMVDPADFAFNYEFTKIDSNVQAEATVTAVPVPLTLSLFALGLAGCALRRSGVVS